MSSSRGRQWRVWALLAAVLVVGVAAATVWIVQRNSQTVASSPEDCAIVTNVAQQWYDLMQPVNEEIHSPDGPSGERSDVLALADGESAMSDELRAAADSVSTPAIKKELNKWADGVAQLAQIQRDAAGPAPGAGSPIDDAAFMDASRTYYEAAGALMESCPGMLPPLEGN
ncbi:MAG: hypothetical protein K0U84_08125 [Actinomycetia bacterium]|nr:hypothetical protein [Actinomycetes bacterium]